jgi:hypothetical protein
MKRFYPIVEKATYEYASTQFNLEGKWKEIALKISERISEPFSGKGRETEPHVTIKYGLNQNNVREVADRVRDFGIVPVTFGKISLFERDNFDVVKIEADGEKLRRLHSLISDLAVKDDYSATGYKGHLTLAYVSPKMGEKWLGIQNELQGVTLQFNWLKFSDTDGKTYKIRLV